MDCACADTPAFAGGEMSYDMRVLVCGGRDYSDAPTLYYELDKIHRGSRIGIIITGGARGADAMAHHWALRNDLGTLQYFADWKALGRKAGPIRNQRMLDEGKPDMVLAFPGGPGTADMIRRAEEAKIRVIRITEVMPPYPTPSRSKDVRK